MSFLAKRESLDTKFRSAKARNIPVVLILVTAGVLLGCRDDHSTISSLPPSPQSQVTPIINIPHLAFRPESEVERVIGRPTHKSTSSNMMVWHQGKIMDATYKNGTEANYLSGRLVSLTYFFPASQEPSTLTSALELAGLPAEAASLGKGGPIFRASIAAGNPLNCCGLTFQLVQVSNDFSYIWVNYVNINSPYRCWAPNMRIAWENAGMREPVTTGDTRVRVGPVTKGGTILDAPTMHDCD